MACRDWDNITPDGGTYSRVPELEAEIKRLEAMLCGVLTVLNKASTMGNLPLAKNSIADVFQRFDVAAAGVSTEELRTWWIEHNAKDMERLRKSAIAKLTPEERIALGL